MRLRISLFLLFPAALLAGWVLWWPWPSPEPQTILWTPDAIVVLGGGDLAWVRVAAQLAGTYPDTPLIVTGDGGYLSAGLKESGLDPSRIFIEPKAESTFENARFSSVFLSMIEAKRVVLVTNWFHVQRSEAVFRSEFPEMEFVASFEEMQTPVSLWGRGAQRREKLAAIYYLLRYGISSF